MTHGGYISRAIPTKIIPREEKMVITCPEDKESGGCSRSLNEISPPGSPLSARSSEVNWNCHLRDSCIGRCWSPSPKRSLLPEFEAASETPILNSLGLWPPRTTSGRMTPVLPVPSSSSGKSASTETKSAIGTLFGQPQLPEISNQSRVVFEYKGSIF